jgi:HNH endonuclease/AP2 domain
MKVIELTRGRATIVDDEDFEYLAQWRWHYTTVGYAMRSGKKGGKSFKVSMSRQIMAAPKDLEVDHINGDKLDNRRENLRLCLPEENIRSRGPNKNNTSGYRGVTYSKKERKWLAQITFQRKLTRIGVFESPEEAHEAYKVAALKLHGDFIFRT